ncbi:MAG TPA: DedA family protein [Thermodesulfovibrionia bacterium]|nr:DedA family protein [Thermodesulfovibrionia bacterium]
MDLINKFISIIFHLDKHLNWLIGEFGIWTYLVLFLIIFCETGLVVTPILPGDSMLFAVGAIISTGALSLKWTLLLLTAAAILGDTVNYRIGNYIGPKAFHNEKSRFFSKKHLETTHNFYKKHGGVTIIIARFIPIIRTFAPFVAGIGQMSYSRFLLYNICGGILWINMLVLAGYFFGKIPFVKKNFSLVIIAIIIISIIPGIVEYFRQRSHKSKQ